MKLRKLLLVGVAALLLVSCQENIDFDLNTDKERLVVDGLITNVKKKHLVKLTRTTSFYKEEAPPAATGAIVSVSDGSTSWPLVEEEPGMYYTSDIAFAVNKNYTLSIDYDGATYTASDYLYDDLKIDTAVVALNNKFDFEEGKELPFFDLILFAQEKQGLGDYYLWKYQVKKPDTAFKDMTPKYSDWTYGSDEFVDGNNPESGWPLFEGIDPEEIPLNTEVHLQTFVISKSYYDFLDAMGKQVERGSLFDGPPANVPTNLENGALGFFTAAAEQITVTSYK